MAPFTSKFLFHISVATIAVLCSATTSLAGGLYSVDLNKTEIVRLPENAGAVVIGNPSIADVTVHSANTLFVVGRGYGETNLVVLNSTGHTIMNADIQVISKLPTNGVRLYNGKDRESYNCSPYCLPSPILGDRPGFIASNSGNARAINNTASTALPTPSSSSSTFLGSAPVPTSQPVLSGSSSSSSAPTSFGSGTDF